MPGMLWSLWLAGLTQLYGPSIVAGPVEIERDVIYARPVSGEELKADVFYPPLNGDLRPAVVFIHGGAWNTNSKSDYHDFARGLARSGMVAITPSFRFEAPNGIWGQVADIKASIRWIKQYGDRWGVDPTRIGLYGSSSGGHLAALAGTALDGEGLSDDGPLGDSSVDAAYYLFGVYDMTDSPIIALSAIFNPDMPLGIPPELLPVFSPINYVSGNEPTTFMMHGQNDNYVPIEEARAFYQAHVEAGVPITLQEIPRNGHGFIKTKPWLRPLIYISVRDFFVSELGQSTPRARIQ